MSMPNAPVLASRRGTPASAVVPNQRSSLASSSLVRIARRHALDYLFLSPMLVLFVGFTIWPILATWIYALYAWDGFESLQTFAGLGHFVQAGRCPGSWPAFAHTFTIIIS